MNNKTSVFIITYNNDRNAWMNHQERLLLECYELSDKQYEISDNPDDADIILLVDVWENIWENGIDCWLDNVGNHPILKKYPEKSFSISDMASPFILHHGIFVNGEKGIISAGRVRTGSYTLFFDNLRNPYIESYVFDDKAYTKKKYLFSFIGRQSHPLRSKIFNLSFARDDILVEDSSKFDFFSKVTDQKLGRQKYYFEQLLHSKFSLCPRGAGASSLRLFESMRLGVVPVIISDAWIPPKGIRWEEFSITIKEKDIQDIEKIITSLESESEKMGRKARINYEENFGKDVYFNFILANCINIQENQRIPESFYQKINPVYISYLKLKNKIRLRSRIRDFISMGDR